MLSAALIVNSYLLKKKKPSGFLALAFVVLNVLDVFDILITFFQQIFLVFSMYVQATELGAMRLHR